MILTGRTVEQQTLESFYKSKRAEFLALYGRRRIGKTFLIKHFFTKRKCVFFHVTGIKDGNLSEQISRFIKAISHTFYKDSEIKERLNWFDALDALTDAINKHTKKNKKLALFLREIVWLS